MKETVMQDEYAPKTRDERLFKLVEECGELQRTIAKAGRFGMEGFHPIDKILNVDAILKEMKDVSLAMLALKPDLEDFSRKVRTPKVMIYCGEALKLKGMEALVRWDDEQSAVVDTVLAQFTPAEAGPYCYGWHRFHKSAFRSPESEWQTITDPDEYGDYEVQQRKTGEYRHRKTSREGWQPGLPPVGEEDL